MTALEFDQVVKHYAGSDAPAVNKFSFTLQEAEILALVGPSGCGKTTILRLVAGLERPDAGRIELHGRVVAGDGAFVPPEQRGIGMVFQDHALFPHLSVFDNVAFGLRQRKSEEGRRVVQDMLEVVGLGRLAGRYPHALSGGERQRVALARALVPRDLVSSRPLLVLMDEPFSSLDADMRLEVREQVRTILKTVEATVIFVTHDQDEALFMGDRLAVFRSGHLEQIGTPEEIYHESATRFVAEFMGSSDFLQGEVVSGGVLTAIGTLAQPVNLPTGAPVEIALRSDDVDFSQLNGDDPGNAVIVERFFRGAFNIYRLRLDSGQVLHAIKPHTEILPPGLRVAARIGVTHSLPVFHHGSVAVKL